jgi:hypothetical protein
MTLLDWNSFASRRCGLMLVETCAVLPPENLS